jgi:hypothetical protein
MRAYAALALVLVAGCGGRGGVVAGPSGSVSAPASGAPSATPTASAGSATGSATGGPASATSRPGGGPSAAPTTRAGSVTLTEDDQGRTVRVAGGTTIVVRLTADQVAPWSTADTSDPNVVRRLSGTTGEGSSETTFRAVRKGRAELSATAHPRCRDVQPPCGAPDRLWSVTVLVS